MRLVKTPDFILNLDEIYALECIPYTDEKGHTHRVLVNGSNSICLLNGGEAEKNRLLNAIYNAGKYDICIELDKDCYEVKEQKKEETDDWFKDFKLE